MTDRLDLAYLRGCVNGEPHANVKHVSDETYDETYDETCDETCDETYGETYGETDHVSTDSGTGSRAAAVVYIEHQIAHP